EPRAIDAVVDVPEHKLVCHIDLATQRCRVIVGAFVCEYIECRVQHSDDLGRLVVDDRAALLVPEDRHRRAAGITRIDQRIDLVQVLLALEAVTGGNGTELPAFLPHHRLDNVHRDDVLETFKLPEYDGAMRPRAGERDVKMIAPARRAKRASAAGGHT